MSDTEQNLVAWLSGQGMRDAASLVERVISERDAMREERVSILVKIADALTTAIRKERWDIVIHVRDAVKETNRV